MFWWTSLPAAAHALLGGAPPVDEDAFQEDAFQDSFQGGSESAAAVVARYASMMFNLLPPGRVWRWLEDTALYKLFAASADELGRLEARSTDLLREADPRRTVELLPEAERELELGSDGTNAERQARIVARLLADDGFRPVDLQNALAPLLGQDAVDVVIIERSRTYAIAVADDREIYRFFIYRNPALPGAYYLAAAQALVDTVAHSHTRGYLIESVDFECDDPYSLTDRDILGA